MLIPRLKMGVLLALALIPQAQDLRAVTGYEPTSIPFTRDLSDLKASLSPIVQDDLEKIQIPLKKLRLRLNNPKKDPTIEPVAISVPRSESGLEAFVDRLAAPGKKDNLSASLLKKIKKAGASNKETARVEFDSNDTPFLNLKALAKELSKENHLVTINSRELIADGKWEEFNDQLSFHLNKDAMAKIQKKVRAGANLSVEEDLLPPFSKRMAGKFIVYRGPNCFHAALSFFDQQLPRNPEVNIKEEEGYHRTMINYDELWRVINNQFYEIDPRSTQMKYGDLMVYFQTPKTASKNIHFKWIRHTSVYLFGPYLYSKGSKSPNTPYTVKTLGEEWKIWQEMVSSGLGLKIYRRSADLDSRLPQGRDDWIY